MSKTRTSSELIAEQDAQVHAVRAPAEAQECLEAAAFALANEPSDAARESHDAALAKVREIQQVQPEPEPITSSLIQSSRQSILDELAAAKRVLQSAAFEAATNRTPEARDALAAARQRVSVLRSELDGIEAAGIEAGRRERQARRQIELDALHELAAQAEAAVDQVPVAWERFRKAVDAMNEAHRALKQAAETARTQVIRCSSAAVQGSTLLTIPHIERELMLKTFDSELDTGVGVMSRSADYFPQAVEAIVEQSRRLIRSGVQAKLEAAEGVQVEQAA